MKKLLGSGLMLFCALLACSGESWSETSQADFAPGDVPNQGAPNHEREREWGGRESGQERKPMGGAPGKGGMMMPPTLVASNDGGVIVLSGHQLSKYDADLNLVKQVTLRAGSSVENNSERPRKKQRMDESRGGESDGTDPEVDRLLEDVLGESQPIQPT